MKLRILDNVGVHPRSATAELIRAIDTITVLAAVQRVTGRPMITEADRARSVAALAGWGR